MERKMAGGGRKGGQVHGEGPLPLPPLLFFTQRALEEGPLHQHMERDFREVRRRTRPMGVFPNEDSAERIFYGVTNGIHDNGQHPLPVISAEKLT
jgi:hypothetical protein